MIGILSALFLFARADNTLRRALTLRPLLPASLRAFPRHDLRVPVQDVVVAVVAKYDTSLSVLPGYSVCFIDIRFPNTLDPAHAMRVQTGVAGVLS